MLSISFFKIGVTVHHMQVNVSHTNRTFEDIVEHDLLPALRDCLIAHSQHKIIWHIQGPSLDLLGPITNDYNVEIHVKKIHQYNSITRRILGYTNCFLTLEKSRTNLNSILYIQRDWGADVGFLHSSH